MTTQIVDIEDIGIVSFTRRKGSKRISLRVKANGVISVNYPWHVSNKEAVAFIRANHDWIKSQQTKLETNKVQFESNQIINTRDFQVKIIPIEQGVVQAVLKKENVIITIPNNVDIHTPKVQEFIQNVFIKLYRKEASKYLPTRVKKLALEHGFTYQKVFIKNLKSKWGSCSSLGNINLNLRLMTLPDHLIDYIILHELTHTKEMNHGPNFWAKLDEVTFGNAKQLEKEMKSMKFLF